MPKMIDLTGQRFGDWQVIEKVPRVPGTSGSVKWKCRCLLCGNIYEVIGNSLRSKRSTCCQKCSSKKKIKDMSGKVIRGIIIYEQANPPSSKSKSTHWRCKCPKCGREDWVVDGADLRNPDGVTMCQHCAALKGLSAIETPYYKDISGRRFGKLIAIRPTEKRLKTSVVWECKCDCGRTCFKASSYLINGDTSSCGLCSFKSKGESKIISLLEEHNIIFETEKIVTINDHKYRFDFYIPEYNCYIEFDGKQHFQENNAGWNESLEEIQNRDKVKNAWIKETNSTLIRIPYTAYNEFEFSDLMPLTSRYLI